MYKFNIEYLYSKRIYILIIASILLIISSDLIMSKEHIVSTLGIFESKQMVSYVKGNKLYFINTEGESVLLYDKVYENIKDSEIETQNGSYYYNQPYCVFMEKDTSIYFIGNIKLASNSGILYRYNKNKPVIKIDEAVRAPIFISPDYKKVAYTDLNMETTFNKIYIKKQLKEKELVDEGLGLFTLGYSDDGNIISKERWNGILG